MPSLLIIDDEKNIRFSLERSLASEQVEVFSAGTAREGLLAVHEARPDAVLLDIRLPDQSGLDVLKQIHDFDPRVPVIMITAHGTTDNAIEAMKRGAFDYLLKPFDLAQLRGLVDRALETSRLARVPAVMPDEPIDETGSRADLIVGRSPPMQAVYKAIGRVAESDLNVLVLGESGSGKELVARAIYQHSRRRQQPFLAINCAAIPPTMLESELFGHERGSFAGAERRRVGKFEQASGGTIFLDEIGDMSGPTQAKVLRLLQDQSFERVGGNETIHTDVRIVAATNQNLEELVAAGRFRRDLYYRLKVYTIEVPPLRERIADLPLLVEHFLRLANRQVGRQVNFASSDAIQLLSRYLWPGNVRELQGAINNAVVNATTDVLTPGCFPDQIRRGASLIDELTSQPVEAFRLEELIRRLLASGDNDIYRQVMHAVDHLLLQEVMKAVDDNQVEASRRLGISRTTLRAKLQSGE